MGGNIAERLRADGHEVSMVAGLAQRVDRGAGARPHPGRCREDPGRRRADGMKKLFGAVYAPSTLGILLREFTHGHTRQLSAVLRGHLLALTTRTGVLDGIEELALVDVDSLLRPVYGHAKQGASFGHTKIANRAGAAQGLAAGHHDLHEHVGAGDRRDQTARRQGGFRGKSAASQEREPGWVAKDMCVAIASIRRDGEVYRGGRLRGFTGPGIVSRAASPRRHGAGPGDERHGLAAG